MIVTLVITDNLTKMAHAFHCSCQSTKQVARLLWDRFVCIYGFLERIHSDQGANFENLLKHEFLEVAGMKNSRTIAYHPWASVMSSDLTELWVTWSGCCHPGTRKNGCRCCKLWPLLILHSPWVNWFCSILLDAQQNSQAPGGSSVCRGTIPSLSMKDQLGGCELI